LNFGPPAIPFATAIGWKMSDEFDRKFGRSNFQRIVRDRCILENDINARMENPPSEGIRERTEYDSGLIAGKLEQKLKTADKADTWCSAAS